MWSNNLSEKIYPKALTFFVRWVCTSCLESDLAESDKIAAGVLKKLASDEKSE